MINALDIVLILSLLWLAWRSLASEDLFRAIVLYIAFALLIALAWARLRAPDIALAEAAIGSGLTGALFLSSSGRLKRLSTGRTISLPGGSAQSEVTIKRVLPAILLSIGVFLGWAVMLLPDSTPGLSDVVQAQLTASGVSNPVTAVLLNFRAFDTLLEIGVLMLALTGVWSLSTMERDAGGEAAPAIQAALLNVLAPLMVIVAAYILWIGSSRPGGAFQAGAILAAIGVLLMLSRNGLSAFCRRAWWLRPLSALAVGGFLLIGVSVQALGLPMLQYPPDWSYSLIFTIETLATCSIGAILALLFAGGRPSEDNADS